MSRLRQMTRPGVGRGDHVVDVAALGRDVGVGVALGVLVDQLGPPARRVGGLGQLAPVDDLDRALGAHHGQLGRRPGEGEVGADGLGVHDDVGAAVGLAGDDLDPRHRRLAVGVEQLGAVADDAAVLLVGAGHEARARRTKVSSGMLKASQVRTKRAAFSEASMSSTPGQHGGLVADDAHRRGRRCGRSRTMMDMAQWLVDLEELAVVDDRGDDLASCRRAGWAMSGMRSIELGSMRGRGRRRSARPRRLLEVVRGQEATAGSGRRRGTPSRRRTTKVATPDLVAWLMAPPSSSRVDVLAGDRLDHVGPGDEHVRGAPCTMKMKSVMAGE